MANLLEEPVLDLNVANKIERGLLGIAVANQTLKNDANVKILMYIFFTLNLSRMVTMYVLVQRYAMRTQIH